MGTDSIRTKWPLLPPLLHPTSGFPLDTMTRRVPEILLKTIEYRSREIPFNREVCSHLQRVYNDLVSNAQIQCISLNDKILEKIWNTEIEKWHNVHWLDTSWLFAECYTYIRVQEAVDAALSCYPSMTGDFDVFSYQKNIGMDQIKGYFIQAANISNHLVSSTPKSKVIEEYFLMSLWSNRLDASLFHHVTNFSSLHEQTQGELSKWNSKILINDLDVCITYLTENNHLLQIDMILDNAGGELFMDLILADAILQIYSSPVKSCCNLKINFHVKQHPWFVSDATLNDIDRLFACLQDAGLSSEYCDDLQSKELGVLVNRWKTYLESGQWHFREDSFFNTPYSYWELSQETFSDYAALRDILSKSDLIVLKGDLNYRKLVYDADWDFTRVDFASATQHVNLAPMVTLRTLKSNTLAGILSKDKVENLKIKHPNWMTSGEFAVVQFKRVNK